MLNELKKELSKNDLAPVMESFSIEDVIKNTEEYYGSLASLEFEINSSELLTSVLNNFEELAYKESLDKNDIVKVDALGKVLLGEYPVATTESDEPTENKVIKFIKTIIEYIKVKVSVLWKKIKSFISNTIEYVKIAGSTMIASVVIKKFTNYCKETKNFDKDIKYTDNEKEKIIKESFMYAYNGELSGKSVSFHQKFSTEMISDIKSFLLKVFFLKLTFNSFKKDVFDIKMELRKLKLYDYSQGAVYGYSPSINDIVKVGKIKHDEIKMVSPFSCSSLAVLLRNLRDTKTIINDLEDMLFMDRKIDESLATIRANIEKFSGDKKVDKGLLKAWNDYRKIVLVIGPKLIKLSLIAARYNRAPKIKTWINATYDKLVNADKTSKK